MDNSPSAVEPKIQAFIQRLSKAIPTLEIERHDERFTSKMAFQSMLDGGLKKEQRKNKGLIDKISATLLLQSYLDASFAFKEKELNDTTDRCLRRPGLKEKAVDIPADYEGFDTLLENMWETMYAASGVGLAAPQVGLGYAYLWSTLLPLQKTKTWLPKNKHSSKILRKRLSILSSRRRAEKNGPLTKAV